MKKLMIVAALMSFMLVSAQVPNYVPTNNLLGYWPFNNNANDASGNGNNGAVTGALPASDRFNNPNAAYSFSGADYIMVPDAQSLSGFDDLTISVWVNLTSFNGIQNIVAKWYHVLNCNSDNDTYLGAFSGSSLYWNTNNHNVQLFSNPPTFTNADLNQWIHLVYTSDHIQGEAAYVNGVLMETYSAQTGSICSSTNPLIFGAGHHTGTIHRFLTGKLDDIGIWNRVLTPCEITQLYTASLAGPSFSVSSTSNTLCAGQSATLSASGANTYTWNNAAGNASLVVSPSVTTTYTVMGATSQSACARTETFTQVVTICTGLESLAPDQQLSLYPNPSKGEIHLQLDRSEVSQYKVRMEDIQGRLILEQNWNWKPEQKELTLSTQTIPAGCYLLKLGTANGQSLKTMKVMISE